MQYKTLAVRKSVYCFWTGIQIIFYVSGISTTLEYSLQRSFMHISPAWHLADGNVTCPISYSEHS